MRSPVWTFKSMWTPARRKPHSKIMGNSMELVPPFTAITASTLLGRLSIRCWNNAVGTCFYSATRAMVRSGTDVRGLGLALSRHSNSSQRCSMGLMGSVQARQVLPHQSRTNHFCIVFCIVHRGIVMLKQERAFPKLLPQNWKHRIV